WVRWLAAFCLAGCAGCGVAAPDIDVASICTLGTVPVLIESGVGSGAARRPPCATFASALGAYRGTLVEGWGAVGLREGQGAGRGRCRRSSGRSGCAQDGSRIPRGTPE